MGVRTESWTVKRSGLEVRMYSREKVELFLLATDVFRQEDLSKKSIGN